MPWELGTICVIVEWRFGSMRILGARTNSDLTAIAIRNGLIAV